MKTTAILTAGGSGSRMKNNIPKQFITVNEIPIIIYTLQRFQGNQDIDEIVVACVHEWQPVLRAYTKEFGISKVVDIVEGGKTGIESIKNCFNSLKGCEKGDLVMIHDGNRPLIDGDIIERNVIAAKKTGVTTTYIDIHDGIIGVDDSLKINQTNINRDYVKSTQTPHTFEYSTLHKIFTEIDDDTAYISVADAATKMGHDVALVRGSEMNFKITTPNDLALFEAIVNTRQNHV